jgi:hypothetical protein
MYFVCHSLGGLVLCQVPSIPFPRYLQRCLLTSRQALNLALWGGEGVEINDMHKGVFMRGGKCNVKGIVFFGTPFQGSDMANVASYAGGLLRLLGGNSALISNLKSKSEGLTTITERFKQVQNIYGINLIIYYESEPLHKRLLPFMVSCRQVSLILARMSKTKVFPRQPQPSPQKAALPIFATLSHSKLTTMV